MRLPHSVRLGMTGTGTCFVKMADLYRQIELSYRSVVSASQCIPDCKVNTVAEEIILPLSTRLDADARSLAVGQMCPSHVARRRCAQPCRTP